MAVTFEKWRDAIAASLLFGLCLIIYARTTSFDFQITWDDGIYVLNNPYITVLTLPNIAALFDRGYAGLYGPVQMLTYMVDYRIWGYDPFGFHLTNVLFHAGNAVLAFLVLRRLIDSFPLAFFAALVFAVHPMNVENVAWIAERKALVASFFMLAAALFYFRYRTVNGAGKGSYALALVSFLLAVFAKATVIGFPMLLVFYEWLQREPGNRAFRLVAPFFLISFFSVIATLWALTSSGVIGGGVHGGPKITAELLFGLVYPTMLTIWWEYLRLLLVPTGLSAFYVPSPRGSFFDPVVLAALFGWIVVLDWMIRSASRAARFWFLWTLVLFAPTAGLIPWVVYYADRYVYLPAIGIYVLAGMAIGWAYRRAAARLPVLAEARNALLVLAMIGVAVIYGTLAYQRTAVWKTELSLWQDTTAKSPSFSDGHVNLGAANLRLGQFDEAEAAYRQAAKLGNPKGDIGVAAALREKQLRDSP